MRSLERNASRLVAVMIMESSWFQAIIVRGKKDNLYASCDVDIIIYFQAWNPEWCVARMSARESKGLLPANEQLCTSCPCVYWLYAWPEGPTPAA